MSMSASEEEEEFIFDSSSSKYKASDSHNKTMEILGKTKKFDQVTAAELREYCEKIIDDDFTIFSVDDLALELMKKYKWNAQSRIQEITAIWNSLKGIEEAIDVSSQDEYDIFGEPMDVARSQSSNQSQSQSQSQASLKIELVPSNIKVSDSNSIPIVIKPGVVGKALLLCECSDPELNFDGDTGAIGRYVVSGDVLTFDLKGRQYAGSIKKGPTVLILNMAPPVGVVQQDYVQTARVEYAVNEYCPLAFEKDLLSDLKGSYTGSYQLTDDVEEFPLDKYEKAALKRKNSGVADKDDDDDDAEKEPGGKGKKVPKISGGRNVSMKKKTGKGKAKSASKNKKTKK